MLLSLDGYLHAKNPRRNCQISSKDDQRILHSDWMRCTTGHDQPKVLLDAPFLWWWFTWKKSNGSIDSFQTYWWLKNTGISLAEKIFSHNWTTLLFTIFKVKKTCHYIKFLRKVKKPYSRGILLLFPQNENFPEKFGSLSHWALTPSHFT